MISSIKDFLEEYWIFILMPVLIVGFLIYLFYPKINYQKSEIGKPKNPVIAK